MHCENHPDVLATHHYGAGLRKTMVCEPCAARLGAIGVGYALERFAPPPTIEAGIPPYAIHDEFVAEWDVARDADGKPITITEEQMSAIWHAIGIVERVRMREGCVSMIHSDNAQANLYKSRLLGRMLLEGLPPTKTKPPLAVGGPAWEMLPGGDPFADHGDRP